MNSLDRRRLLQLLGGVGAAGVTSSLAACVAPTGADDPKSPVRIGLLVPATGSNKAIGGDLENGFRLYLETRNSQLAGHRVELAVEDEGDAVPQGIEALKKLHAQDVVAVVGVANPDLLREARSLIEEKRIPLLAAHGSSSEMASAVYIWRTAYLNNEPGRAIGQYLRNRGKTALVGLRGDIGAELIGGFNNDNGGGIGPIYVPATGSPDKGHLSGAVQDVVGSGAENVFTWLPANYLIPFMQQLPPKIGVYAPGIVSEGAAVEQLTGARNLFTAMQYSADLNNAANRAFSSLFQTRYQRSPTAYAVAAYDAAQVLDSAIALIVDEAVTAVNVNLKIANVGQVVSPRGNWQFTQARAPQQKWYLRQIRMDGPVLSNVLVSELSTLA
ncbi:MAG TPA: ABC transporter substrate-binding protein [Candidatus Limnocylindrales bacterium]|nr:ABC transporter substrate-binding protein [Candidatus Limnocylindrales bacterium]